MRPVSAPTSGTRIIICRCDGSPDDVDDQVLAERLLERRPHLLIRHGLFELLDDHRAAGEFDALRGSPSSTSSTMPAMMIAEESAMACQRQRRKSKLVFLKMCMTQILSVAT